MEVEIDWHFDMERIVVTVGIAYTEKSIKEGNSGTRENRKQGNNIRITKVSGGGMY